jgi:F5/8 type C domain/Glycosyl hydrolases family 43
MFFLAGTLLLEIAPVRGVQTAVSAAAPAGAAPSGWVTIHNDFYWYDQDGALINTRAGCLRKFGDTFYWYGLLKWQDPKAWNDQTCYSSTDLVHWTYKGIVLHVDAGANRMDVLYNDSTKKYVMFLKYGGDAATLGIATSSTPDGQFTFLSQTLVDGANIGDMSVYEDDDGKAYLAYVWDQTGPNRQHGIYLMSADYLTLDKRIYLWDISSREGPHIFKRNGLYYYGTSETNGVKPSPTRYYTSANLAGPWSAATMLSTPGSSTTYETQCDFVFPFTGTQGTCYMFDADRWLPTGPKQGGYLWLPLEFNNTVPTLNYYQDWDLNVSSGAWRAFDYSRNLASGKTASASSISGANTAANAFDSKTYLNYTDTRWESAASDPQWLMIDLGAAMVVNRVILKWDSSYAKAFQIQMSTNSISWTDVYSTTIGAAYSVTDVSFPTTTARYVRMYGTQRGTSNGYSLFDFMVLNDSAVTPVAFTTEKPEVSSGIFLKCKNAEVCYVMPHAGTVKLEAFNVAGKLSAVLVNGFQNAGPHGLALSGKLNTGLYVFRLTVGNRRVIALRARVSTL